MRLELEDIKFKKYSEAPPPLYGRGGRVVRLKSKNNNSVTQRTQSKRKASQRFFAALCETSASFALQNKKL
jgi:hypothetical protein